MRRGHHLERNIHGKELGSILLRHRIKISTLIVHTISDFTAYSKISTLERGLKKLRIRMPDSPDTCGRKPYPERNSCRFKNIRIRVDWAWTKQFSRILSRDLHCAWLKHGSNQVPFFVLPIQNMLKSVTFHSITTTMCYVTVNWAPLASKSFQGWQILS